MPIVRAADAVLHEMHGARFTSYAAPARGSTELCAWRLDLPGGATGMPHTVSHEEILFVLSGSLQVTFEPSARPGAAGTEPTTSDPAPARPGADRPGADTPGTDRPGADTPGTDRPGADTPETARPGADTPETARPGADTPETDTPGTARPGAVKLRAASAPAASPGRASPAPSEAGGPGDVIVVPAGSTISVGNPGAEPAAAWVTTSAGLTATLPDGTTITPPWVR